jgi:NACHT domain
MEVAAISLGAAIVKSSCKYWLHDNEFGTDVSGDLVDAFASRVTNRLDRRKLGRFFEDCTDIVAGRLMDLLDAEYRNVPDNERMAAVAAVRDTFLTAELTAEDLLQADLDTRLVERHIRPTADRVLARSLLSEGGTEVYRLVRRESCSYLVEVVTSLPVFTSGALTELLRRQTSVLETLRRVLERLPQRRGTDDFAADYRRAVANKLDRMELLGVTLRDENRRYPLSVAYLDLGMRRQRGPGHLLIHADSSPGEQLGTQAGLRAEQALGSSRRTLVIGPAGSGKTTLLHWLAVRSAQGDFPGALGGWSGSVPFFIPLRRYVNRGLPVPEEFPLTIGSHVAHEMPPGWVHDQLRAGTALVLVDGVDEMPEHQREQVRLWLDDLCTTWSNARYVVTSRPSAVADGWLARLAFAATELQPMSAADVSAFIRQWHEAITVELLDPDERAAVPVYEETLLRAIDTDRHLRALTVSPLLCALMCALNRERRTHLPHDRMEIYAAALDMLVERRDRERGVVPGQVALPKTDKLLLLQDIALWLVRNAWSDAPVDRVIAQVSRTMAQLRDPSADPGVVFRDLLERSGVLREPAAGRVDFIHRTFQEYLAGKAAAENDEIGELLRNAHNDQWREVVVMAAGHAQPEQCAELIRGLIASGRYDPKAGSSTYALAVACLPAVPRLDPGLRQQVELVAATLLPPRGAPDAELLAGAGEMMIDLLRSHPPRTDDESAYSIRAASRIGGPNALRLVAEIFARAQSSTVRDEIIAAWRFFKPDQYAEQVLARCWPPDAELALPDLTFADALSAAPTLRAIRCDLTNNRAGIPYEDLPDLAANLDLRKIVLTQCASQLDLTPLARLPRLEDLEIDCIAEPPDLAWIGMIARLSVKCETLPPSYVFPAATWLELRGCDGVVDLGILPAHPGVLQRLSLFGFRNLTSLSGIERQRGLTMIELFECGLLTDVAPLASIPALRAVTLELYRGEDVDLHPIGDLPELRKLSLMGNGPFDLTALAGKSGLVVSVPMDAKVKGARKLGPGSEVIYATRPSGSWR